jgi:hypothetical protein
VRVPNESDAFVFTSPSQRGRGFTSASADVLAMLVESEDSADVRVVVDEPLQPEEATQWVGVVRSQLHVPEGKLVLAGGISYLVEEAAWAGAEARVVELPAGSYHATLYCHASSPNGRWCAEQVDDEPLGAWFRRTRAGAPFPAWLHNLCVYDPEQDPGHQKQWKKAREAEAPAVVDFLLHLERGDGIAAAPGPDGVYQAGECRKPEPFPLGLPAVGLAPHPGAAVPPAVVAVPTGAAPTRQPIAGGPVAIPLGKLHRLARLAWLCHPYTQPTVRITFPRAVPALEDVEGATMSTRATELTVAFDDDGQPAGAFDALNALGKQFSASVPDGTTVELDMARKNRDHVGLHS